MASKVIQVTVMADGVMVTIEHLDTDSFSRSVDRAASVAWRNLPVAVRLRSRHRVASFAHTCEGRTCVSTVAWGPSFEAAEAALATEHVARTGCGLLYEDFDPDDPRCADGGQPWEHPRRS